MQNEFKPGNKTYTIKIPDYIKDSSKHNKLSFVRGYFDTDGCLRFDKNKSNLHKYPRIEFGSASQQMIYDLKELLSELGFKNHIWKDNKYLKLCIAGRVMLEKWIKEVKPKNPKHLNKYHSFRKTGYYATEKQVAQEE